MNSLFSQSVSIVPSSDTLRSDFGTGLGRQSAGGDILGQLSLWLNSQLSYLQQIELQCVQVTRVLGDCGDVFGRVMSVALESPLRLDARNGRWFAKLPANVIYVAEVYLSGKWLINGVDFRVDGDQIYFDSDSNLIDRKRLMCRGVLLNSFVQQRLFAAMFGVIDYSLEGRRFYGYLQKTLRDGLTRLTTAELVGSAIGCEWVKTASTVVDIVERPGMSPVVVTEHEVIRGANPTDTAVVSIGDAVSPGDFVFNVVQVWDCNTPRPDFINSLKLPPSVLRSSIKEPITIPGAEAAPTVVTVRDKLRVRYPITGSTADVARYWVLQDAAEDNSGFYLANYLANDLSPSASQLTGRAFNWIDVLWSTWLRFGALIVKVSYPNSQPITDAQRYRLQQIRRAVPPWMLYLVQAEEMPNYAC